MNPETNGNSFESPNMQLLESGMTLGVALSWGLHAHLTEKVTLSVKWT